MTSFDFGPDLPSGDSPTVRLFPLPNLVMFPHVVQPLHIFEPRYCAMLDDALADDKLIAMAMLEPGWEGDYLQRPPIVPIVCVGRVVSHTREGDDRHNILLLGMRRARVVRELPPAHAYREADVVLLDDQYGFVSQPERDRLKQQLATGFRTHLPQNPMVQEQYGRLVSSDVPLGVLTDIMAFSLDLGLRDKRELLEELNAERRAIRLLQHLSQATSAGEPPAGEPPAGEPPAGRTFPPPFSAN